MKQRKYHRRTEAEDDQLPAPNAPLQQISADSLIVSKSHREDDKISDAGNATVHTIRDLHSGCSLAVPLKEHNQEAMYRNFKFFAGLKAKDPNILVRSDAAREITNSVRELGWHVEASLENKWPHNAAHERYQGTLKSVTRACMLQSGFPRKAWDIAISYSSVALAITQLSPIHSWERDAAGNVLEDHKYKIQQTCWTVFHEGEVFNGTNQPFGRLCYYWDRKAHPLMPTTSPGLFCGWRLERGLRYRSTLLILGYEHAREGKFDV